MRKVRHKNVVQFIGACTRKPNLCIVFEYMSGGSVYDYIRRVSKPMWRLHSQWESACILAVVWKTAFGLGIPVRA